MMCMISFIEKLLYPTDNINHVACHHVRTIGLKVCLESLQEAVN